MQNYIKKIFNDSNNIASLRDFLYKIVIILRDRISKAENEATINKNVYFVTNAFEYRCYPASVFIREAEDLLFCMNNNSHTLMQQIDVFVNNLNANSITAPSTSDDVKIIIQDSSFSIKSQLGSASTLLNAGNTTNILYRLSGKNLTDDDIANINGIENHLPRMKALFDMGCKLEYVDTPHDTFRDNLQFLDTSMPRFIAECLVADCEESSTSKVSDVVAVVAKRNPLHYMGKNVETFYEHKMKVLLVDVALGMTPSKQWLGKYDANGGYLVVRKDGEVVCYHFYNRNDIEDYLYYNTRFERASRSRYGFGSLYRGDDGQVYIKLNLQIRFLK
jgi:type II restriction enzyme